MGLDKKQKGFTIISSHNRGLTLVELVVVVGILGLLLAITLIAINPGRIFGQSNDTIRKSDVGAILDAVNQYMVDHRGQLPAGISLGVTATVGRGPGLIDICADLVPDYIAAIPVDPNNNGGNAITNCGGGNYDTGYTIVVEPINKRITVHAPLASSVTSVTR